MAGKAIVGRKVGMTQIWNEENHVIPVTVLEVAPCRVVQIKTPQTDGYSALQVTQGEGTEKNLNQPQIGHFDKAGVEPGRRLLELRLDDTDGYEIGQEISADIFSEGDMVDVSSVSKGKGFAGVMKRWNFGGLRASHGVSVSHRSHGSTGQRQDPGKVFKGKKMAGHMGDKLRTMQNIEIIKTDLENELLYLKGSIPGSKNSEVMVKKSVKNISKMTIGEKQAAAEEAKKTPEKKKK